ncbi:MAG TPA: HEAT repeat domain-containing protein [Bryobacteraceae bacterium]|nr:HEAT repeat domain-containing protein [Bryobacteraceae bacterium]
MAHRNIELEIERLGSFRQAPANEAAAALRKALSDRVNMVVAKAAKLVAELQLHDLLPDLLRAYDRLFESPVSRDPQCWGKNAIANALRDLGYCESPPFVRGIRHVQMEPSFGKPEDTAATLRGICLLSLPGCNDLRRGDILRHMVDLLADPALTVRVEAVRGLQHMEGDDSALLLRLKARLGDPEAAVVGQVFDSLLQLEGENGIPFVSAYLHADPDARHEAALALGSSRLPAAVDLLKRTWDSTRESEFREVLLRAIGLSRQQSGIEFLLNVIRESRTQEVKIALEVLALDRNPETRRLAEVAAAEAGPAIRALCDRAFT